MLLLKDISKQYSGRAILDNITLTLSKKRTALIGKNGSGKSTLMKIIAGLEYCDSGRIVTQKNAVIEYLPQYSLYNFRGSIYEEVLARLNSDKIQTLSDEKTKIIQKLESSGEPNENLLIRLDEIVEEIQALELKIKQKNSVETLLLNLGFNKEDWDKKAGTLSGGWQMRLALARVLVREPDIILLDEPTNYLDIIAIKFLKDWLKNFKGELIVVSHDRDFLNGVVEETWEIFNGEIAVFRGNYDYYLAEKEQRLKVLKRRREKQLDEIKSLQDYCDKNRFNAAHAALAQSKQKQLERLKSDLVVLPKTPPAMTFNLPTPKRGGEIVVEMDKISHNFGELKVISNYKRIISRGERVALVGRNGFGKSTLMNIIGQELVPTSGICKIGKEIEICYFRQYEIATLPQNMTVIEFVESIAPFDMMTKVKSILACFLFYEEEWDKKIAVLSGGEKVRLAFIKFILTPGNLLLLDEPTTHLDIDSKEILLKTLQNIPATIVFVSHDSYFINSLATSVVYFKGRCDFVNFPGNFKEYLDLYGDETVEEEEETRKESDLTAIKGKRDFARQKERRNATNKLKKDIDEIQNSIDEKEREKENLLNKIIKSPNDYKLAKELSDIDDEILALMEDWEEKSERLEKIREGER